MACDLAFKKSFDLLVASVPKVLRLRIPETLGDGGFISNFDEATPSVQRSHPHEITHEGYRVPNIVTTVAYRDDDAAGYMLNRLWSMPAHPSSRRVLVGPSTSDLLQFPEVCKRLPAYLAEDASEFLGKGRNKTPTHSLRLKLSKSVVRQWYDLGSWI